MELKVEN